MPAPDNNIYKEKPIVNPVNLSQGTEQRYKSVEPTASPRELAVGSPLQAGEAGGNL